MCTLSDNIFINNPAFYPATMYFHNAVELLEKDPKFIDWKKDHKKCSLSYGFFALDSQISSDWQLGYYDDKQDSITTFAMQAGKLIDSREDKVLKKKGAKVLPIDLKKIKLNEEKVLELVDKFQKESYPQETSIKTIIIIQKLPKLGNVWNVTLMTQSFKTLNIKLDAETGKVKEHSLAPLMQK